jgi:ferrochelatase
METAVLLLNFGEPENPTLPEVVPFLERIFSLNAPLMGGTPGEEEIRARSRRLAEARAPGLIEEYLEIGGSPLHAQAREQAEKLGAELDRRGRPAAVLLGMQFTDPSIESAVREAREMGARRVIALPVYPLAGPSTTVAALAEVDRSLGATGWDVPVSRLSGWHRHHGYIALRADAVRETVRRAGTSLEDPDTRLVFSAHGTPIRYLEDGNGYDLYVRDFCRRIAAELGVTDFELGYQNHTNRPGVEWTKPDIDEVIERVDARRMIVDPVSFMHEQSETLAELDHELRERAEARGIGFHRVRIPHADAAFISVLADLVEAALAAGGPGAEISGVSAGGVEMRQCLCSPVPGTLCTNPILHG